MLWRKRFPILFGLLLAACAPPPANPPSWTLPRVAEIPGAGTTQYSSRIHGCTVGPMNDGLFPFAVYLNGLHRTLHPIFADGYLGQSGKMEGSDDSVLLELIIDGKSGALLEVGVVRASHDASFDAAAVGAFKKSFPLPPPDPRILSADGRVYITWELHKNPSYACSTYFARPYIMRERCSVASPTVPTPPVPATLASPILAPLQDQKFGDGDCGCALRLRGSDHEPKVFVLNALQEQDKALINIHGADVFVTRAGTTTTESVAIGAQRTEIWKGNNVAVRLDYTTTKTCEAIADDCEGTWYSVLISAASGGQTQMLEAQGYCGC